MQIHIVSISKNTKRVYLLWFIYTTFIYVSYFLKFIIANIFYESLYLTHLEVYHHVSQALILLNAKICLGFIVHYSIVTSCYVSKLAQKQTWDISIPNLKLSALKNIVSFPMVQLALIVHYIILNYSNI